MIFLYAFLVGGIICLLAQLCMDLFKLLPAHIVVIAFAGAGALMPISSFGHSLTHAAVEAAVQSDYLGLFTGIFDLTSSGIAAAIFFSFVIALVCRPRG